MNSKILWGLVIVALSLFNLVPKEIRDYVFNYQIVMILVGAYFLTKKKKFGWIFLLIGVCLYVTEYIWTEMPLFVIPLVFGLIVIGLGIKEVVDKRQLTKFSGKNIKESKDEEVIEAEEIKK